MKLCPFKQDLFMMHNIYTIVIVIMIIIIIIIIITLISLGMVCKLKTKKSEFHFLVLLWKVIIECKMNSTFVMVSLGDLKSII